MVMSSARSNLDIIYNVFSLAEIRTNDILYSYVFPNLGTYWCVASNEHGEAVSQKAQLDIACKYNIDYT